MKIKTIHIKNFKSIKDSGVINCNDGMNAFIGKNGTGKSAVFEAVNFVLGNKNPFDRVPTELILTEIGKAKLCNEKTYDGRILYFNLLENVEIEIPITFTDLSVIKCKVSFSENEVDIKFHPLCYRNHPFQLDDNEISLPKVQVSLTIEKNDKEQILTEEERRKYKIFYLSSDRLTDSFGKNEICPPKRKGQLVLSDDAVLTNSSGEKATYLHEKITLYCYNDTDVLFIDEPELYLDPHAKKRIYHKLQKLSENKLQKLSENGTQIFYITHSSEFLSYYKSHEICRFYLEGNETKIAQSSYCVGLKDNSKTIEPNKISFNNAFFADKIFLVEGYTDVLFLEEIIKNPKDNNISIIECGGKENIQSFHTVYSNFKIDTFILFDKDVNKKCTNKKINEELSKLKSFGFDEDLENFLFKGDCYKWIDLMDTSHLKSNLDKCKDGALLKLDKDLKIEFIKAWINCKVNPYHRQEKINFILQRVNELNY